MPAESPRTRRPMLALPLQSGGTVVTNQVYVSIVGGMCMTTTGFAARVIVDVIGAVVPFGGAAYVDLPFTLAATVVGPASNHPIDFSAFGVPSDATGVALWIDALSTTNGFAVVHPCGPPSLSSQSNWVAGEPSTSLIAGVATIGAGVCIDISDGASVDISIDGYYRPGATPTPTSAPQIRWSQDHAPGFIGTSPQRLFDTRDAGVPIAAGQSYRLDLSRVRARRHDCGSDERHRRPTERCRLRHCLPVRWNPTRHLESQFRGWSDSAQPRDRRCGLLARGVLLRVGVHASSRRPRRLLRGRRRQWLRSFVAGPDARARGVASPIAGPAKVGGHTVFDFDVSPFIAPDATAVVFNLTATDVRNPGFVTAYPCGQQPPNASNLNVSAGQTVPNLVTVAVRQQTRLLLHDGTAQSDRGSRRLVCAIGHLGLRVDIADALGRHSRSGGRAGTSGIGLLHRLPTGLPGGQCNGLQRHRNGADGCGLPHCFPVWSRCAERIERQLRCRAVSAQHGDLGHRRVRRAVDFQLCGHPVDRRCQRLLHGRAVFSPFFPDGTDIS